MWASCRDFYGRVDGNDVVIFVAKGPRGKIAVGGYSDSHQAVSSANEEFWIMKTIESLGIFWTLVDGASSEVYQGEVGGLVFYGYWRGKDFSGPVGEESFFETVWEGSADVKFRKWDGEDMGDFSVELKINIWPEGVKWLSCVEQSLRWFVERGAIVSWCGSELCSPSLEVFSEVDGFGSVYAAYSADLGFFYGSELEGEYQDMNVSQLREFSKIVFGRS